LEAEEGGAKCRFITLPAEPPLRLVLWDCVSVAVDIVPERRQLIDGADMLFNGEGEAFNV
jgi:hypothetical protein